MAVDLVVARLIAPLIADTKAWDKGFQSATKTATSWSEKVKSAVIDQGTKLIFDGAKMAARGVLDLGKSLVKMTQQAAPLPAIGASFRAMAGQVDLSLDALRKAAAGTVSDFDLMRKANVALTGAGADLAQAFGKDLPALLEGARAAARATGQDVGFLFESLVSGVKRGSPLLIDNTGIVLKLGEANQALASELGKSVEQLTAQEKSIAILNATVEASGKLVAQLGSDELTAAEQLQRFNAILQNTRDQIGIGLQPVLSNFVGRMSDLGNRVLPPLVSFIETKVAPALDLIVDAMGNAAEAAVDAGDSFVGKFGAKLSQAADSALRWGIQISTELATGLIKGAASALVAAMQFIGNMLTAWLAPGSPPKVAPKLDRWGGEWMAELLRGMTEADFGVLEKIQGPLSKVLSGPAFKNISGEIIEALSTGDAGPALFDKIAASAGKFGNEIAELARRQVALSKATDEVRASEENLAKAREEQVKAKETVDALADEFNKLLAAGADPAILDAKRAEFEAAKDSLSLADQEVAAAEDRKTAVEESLSPLQEQVLLQDKLLDQLFKLSTVGESATEKIKAGIAGIGAAIASLPAPKLPAPDFSAVTAAFTEAKGNLSAKFADLFAPVTQAWENEIRPTLTNLGKEWGRFTGIVKKFWDDKVAPVVEQIKAFLPPDLTEKIGMWAGTILVAGAAIAILTGLITLLLSPIFLLAVGVVTLIALWTEYRKMTEGLNAITELLVSILVDKLLVTLDQLAFVVSFTVFNALNKVSTFLTNTFTPAWEAIKRVVDTVKTAIDNIGLALASVNIPSWADPGSPTPFELGLRGMAAAMSELSGVEVPRLADSLLSLPTPGGGTRAFESNTSNFFNQTINTNAGVTAVTQGFNINRSMVQAT